MTSDVYHKPLVYSTEINSHEWVTKCGWAFGKLGRYFLENEIPKDTNHKEICTTCLPRERKAMRDAQGEDDTVSTVSSSSSESSEVAAGT